MIILLIFGIISNPLLKASRKAKLEIYGGLTLLNKI